MKGDFLKVCLSHLTTVFCSNVSRLYYLALHILINILIDTVGCFFFLSSIEITFNNCFHLLLSFNILLLLCIKDKFHVFQLEMTNLHHVLTLASRKFF